MEVIIPIPLEWGLWRHYAVVCNALGEGSNVISSFFPIVPPKLQIFSHVNNSQNKVICDRKEEEIVNLKLVAECNKTDVISHCL